MKINATRGLARQFFFGGETKAEFVACFGISFSVKINGAANESELVVQPYRPSARYACSPTCSHPLSWAALHPRELLGEQVRMQLLARPQAVALRQLVVGRHDECSIAVARVRTRYSGQDTARATMARVFVEIELQGACCTLVSMGGICRPRVGVYRRSSLLSLLPLRPTLHKPLLPQAAVRAFRFAAQLVVGMAVRLHVITTRAVELAAMGA